MSAPLKLTTREVVRLGQFMQGLNQLSRDTGVRIDPYGNATLGIGDNNIEVKWSEESREYETDDRIGR